MDPSIQFALAIGAIAAVCTMLFVFLVLVAYVITYGLVYVVKSVFQLLVSTREFTKCYMHTQR